MKRNIFLSIGIIVGFGAIISMAWVGVSRASDVRTGDQPVLAASETTDNSLYIAGNIVKIHGTVKGDVFCAGQDVEVTGVVEGDVICAGQSVRVTGTVNGDVRVAGQDIELDGAITGSLSAFGESVIVRKDAKVGRDFTFGASRVAIEGRIERDALGNADIVKIASHIGRNVDGEISTLNLDATAHIAGSLTYQGGAAAHINQGAVVEGETKYTQTYDNSPQGLQAALWIAFYGLVATLMVGLAAILLAPRAYDVAGMAIFKRPVVAFGAGAASILLLPLLSLVLFMSLFGVPLAILLIMALGVGVMGSVAITSYGVGTFIVEKLKWPARGRRLSSLFIGSVTLFLFSCLPIVGVLILFIAIVMGLGAAAVALGGRLYPKKAKSVAK
jgi:cytoskeletal protein CcmA (bactofilin family)